MTVLRRDYVEDVDSTSWKMRNVLKYSVMITPYIRHLRANINSNHPYPTRTST